MARRGRKPHPLALAKLKYHRHRAQAKYRNIGFNISFEEWYEWWLQNGVDKNTETFTLQDPDRLCMCRFGDVGAYELGNVYCETHSTNAADAHKFPKRKQRNMRKSYQWKSRMVNILELKELAPTLTYNQISKFKPDVYDYWRRSESCRLTNQFRSKYGTLRKRTEYHWEGEWYPTLKAVGLASSRDPMCYKKYLMRGTPGFAKRITRKLEDYIVKHSIFPDPIIPVDK